MAGRARGDRPGSTSRSPPPKSRSTASLPSHWRRERAHWLKSARAFAAGVEGKQTDVSMRIDANGFEIERLAIADFGGAGLALKGRIDGKTQSPRGAVTLDLDARALDGVTALLGKIAPRTAG